MRVAVHDFAGTAFVVELSRELAARGHQVLHLYAADFTVGRGPLDARHGDPDGLRIEPVRLGRTFDKYRAARRLVDEVQYGRAVARRLDAFGPEVVLSSTTPLFVQAAFFGRARRRGARIVYWQQDIYSEGMRRLLADGVPVVGAGMGRAFQRLERRQVRQSDTTLVITDDFLPVLGDWGVDLSRVRVRENWAPLGDMPVRPKDTEWSRAHGLHDRPVVTYAGTLGLKHDPSALLHLARHLDRRPDGARLVVVSEGPFATQLAVQGRHEGLDSLLVLPFQPFAHVPDVLGAADVLVVLLEHDAGAFSVPSKLLAYHCAERPLVVSVPSTNLAARIVAKADSGRVVEPGDVAGLATAVDELLDDPACRAATGRNARAYAEDTFAVGPIADEFEGILAAVKPVEESVPETVEERERDHWDHVVPTLEEALQEYHEGPEPNTELMLDVLGDVRSVRVLDFACGAGVTSCWLAARGAEVVGVDISPNSLERARELAGALGLDPRFVLVDGFDFRALGTFDAVVGRWALHHVDVAEAAAGLAAVLRPGGRAAFVETMATNPVLRFARDNLLGLPGIPRLGTLDEHPLTTADVETLRGAFGRARIELGQLTFFRILDRQVLRYRSPRASKVLGAVDDRLQRAGRTSLSYHQVVVCDR